MSRRRQPIVSYPLSGRDNKEPGVPKGARFLYQPSVCSRLTADY